MLKKIIFRIIKICPFNSWRVLLYKYLFNYKIGKNVQIGKSIINAENVEIGNNVIVRHNNTIRCKNLAIGNNTKILSGNTISGKKSFKIGQNSRIINDHFIDLWNDVEIGNNTWLAGKGSQIWTHGSIHTKTGKKNLSVKIENDIYIGSKTCIAPGVKIKSINLIGLGSVLTKSIESSKNIIAGNPAKIIKENINWKENW